MPCLKALGEDLFLPFSYFLLLNLWCSLACRFITPKSVSVIIHSSSLFISVFKFLSSYEDFMKAIGIGPTLIQYDGILT